MKFLNFWLVVSFLVAVVAASNWSPEDYEIFSLNDKVRQDLGADATFYSWLGLSNKASVVDINKAYRKLSRLLHPDKISTKSKAEKKVAEERFQRLSAVGNILKDQSLKRRYDYFYAKGFPKWKGTGYFYSKFRPGFVLTLFLLFIIVSGLHYASLTINRKQDVKRVIALKQSIKAQAWGGSQLPPSDGSDRKVVNEQTGKQFLVTPDGNVYLVESGDNLSIIDEHSINISPHWKETLLFKFPCFLWNVSGGKLTSKTIDTTYVYEGGSKTEDVDAADIDDSKKKQKKKAQRGKKVELPNGKVIYGRSSGRRN